MDFPCSSPRLLVDVKCKYCSLLLSLDFVLSSSLPCICITIMKSRTEIVVIIAQFPHILPVQFQWPNNVLAAHPAEHNGSHPSVIMRGSRVSQPLLHLRVVSSAGLCTAPKLRLTSTELPSLSAAKFASGFWFLLPKKKAVLTFCEPL